MAWSRSQADDLQDRKKKILRPFLHSFRTTADPDGTAEGGFLYCPELSYGTELFYGVLWDREYYFLKSFLFWGSFLFSILMIKCSSRRQCFLFSLCFSPCTSSTYTGASCRDWLFVVSGKGNPGFYGQKSRGGEPFRRQSPLSHFIAGSILAIKPCLS